ncbi:MAG: DUF1624 domain-containing protein [Moorea sp. SIO2B7]|nr:DUF1624 domain-containing protein [Moorena sp. SIO2B7]
MVKNVSKASIHWRELDILRGLAAILMIVNHAGYKILIPNLAEGGLSGTLIFIGSFAPVLFFFITGIGYGIQSNRRKKTGYWTLTLYKVVILVLADQFFFWDEGRWLGLNFLGFIGFSTLVMAWLRSSRRPLFYAMAGFAAVSCLRYLIGPYLHSLGSDRGLLTWIIGTSGISGISYPLAPWLAYPFVGYLIGVAAMHYREFVESHRWEVISGLLILACFPGVAGIMLSRSGASFHRWSTVGIGFYVISFTIIFLGLAWSLAFIGDSRLKIWQNTASLRGISSLAVVPVHYYLIHLLTVLGIVGLGFFGYSVVTIGVLTASFFLARSLEQLSKSICQIKNRKLIWLVLVTILLLAASITLIYNKESAFLVMSTRTLGQIILCLLLVIRWE